MSFLSCVKLFATPWTVTHQVPLPMGFSRQECWSGLPVPPPRNKVRMSIFTTSVQHCTGSSSQKNYARKKNNKGIQIGKEEIKCKWYCLTCCCSVIKSCLILWPHGLQHTRVLCPPLSPRHCSDSCPLSQWCYLAISSSAALSPFAFNLSQHQGLSNESALCMKWPKYWSFSFRISPSNEYTGLISFRID